nr:unnamed protein product [Digitaria exilis]
MAKLAKRRLHSRLLATLMVAWRARAISGFRAALRHNVASSPWLRLRGRTNKDYSQQLAGGDQKRLVVNTQARANYEESKLDDHYLSKGMMNDADSDYTSYSETGRQGPRREEAKCKFAIDRISGA